MPDPIGIAGAGAWGTALANAAAAAGNDVVLWMRSPEQASALATGRTNERFLPGIRLHDRITPTAVPSATTLVLDGDGASSAVVRPLS